MSLPPAFSEYTVLLRQNSICARFLSRGVKAHLRLQTDVNVPQKGNQEKQLLEQLPRWFVVRENYGTFFTSRPTSHTEHKLFYDFQVASQAKGEQGMGGRGTYWGR